MISANEGKTASSPGICITNTTAEHTLDLDTTGSDQLNLYITCSTHNSSTEAIDSITVYESDTVTQATNMTKIAALSSDTATAATTDNILPTAAVMALGGVVQEIQIDLRRRKKYLGVAVISGPVAAGAQIGILARLTRNAESADSATEKDQVDLGAITVSGCMQVITVETPVVT